MLVIYSIGVSRTFVPGIFVPGIFVSLELKKRALICKERKLRLLEWSMFEKKGENEAF